MIEYALRMPPDIVIRPSGIWDSRAPFHNFLLAHRRIIRTYNVLTLAVCRLTHEAGDARVAARPAQKWLRAQGASMQSYRSWGNYRRTLPRSEPDILPKPTVRDVASHLDESLYDLRRHTVIAYSAAFETFTQCWALNYLLSVLENGHAWNHRERSLAQAMSPEHGADALPTLHRILDCWSFLKDGLGTVPAFVTKDSTDSDDPVPISGDVNALEAIKTWRSVRNLIVHRGGIISLRFLDRHGPFFRWLRGHYPYMHPLEVGGGFLFYDDVVRAVFAVHYRAARWMSDLLEDVSSARRGHPQAPNPKPAVVFFPGQPPQAPVLLLPGDHEPSYEWTHSMGFRTHFRRTAPRDPRRRLARKWS